MIWSGLVFVLGVVVGSIWAGYVSERQVQARLDQADRHLAEAQALRDRARREYGTA